MLSDAAKLSAASLVAYAVNLVGGLALAGILAPALYGIWKTVQLALQYTQFANLGISYGMHKLSPPLVARGEIRRYEALVGISMGFSFLLPSGIALGLAAAAAFVADRPTAAGLVATAILIPMQQFYHHAELALAIEKRFGAKARIFAWSTIVRVGLSLLLGWYWGLEGALAAFALVLAWSCAAMWRASRMGFRPALHPRSTPKLLRIGAPLTLALVGELVISTSDKWLVAGLLGSEAMGLYQMAVFPLPLMLVVPMSLRQVVNVEVYEKAGRGGKLEAARPVFDESLRLLALSSFLLAGPVYFGVAWMVARFLPAYADSIVPLKVHAIGVYPLLLVQTTFALLVVSDLLRIVFRGQLLAAAGCAAAGVALYAGGHLTILSMLLVQCAGWLFYTAAILWRIERRFGASAGEAARALALLFAPMVLLAAGLPALDWAAVGVGAPQHSFVWALIGGAGHAAVSLVLLWMFDRKTGLVRAFIGKLKARAAR